MQLKNIISFIFLFQSVISFPRRNRKGRGVEDLSTSTVSSIVSSTVSSTVSSSLSSSTHSC